MMKIVEILSTLHILILFNLYSKKLLLSDKTDFDYRFLILKTFHFCILKMIQDLTK